MEILQYTFFQNALIGSLLASIVCGIVGTYIVTRRLVLISGGLTHASFGGIGLGVYFGINPILSALVFSVLSAFGIQWMSSRAEVREDSAIALFWTFGMSIGIICCFMTPGFMTDLSSYLFGNILTIGTADLWLLGGLAVFTSIFFWMLMNTIIGVAFDPIFARSQHQPVTAIEYIMMALIAVTIVSTLRMVGIVLAISLLTIPQMTANMLTCRFRQMIGWSILFGCVDCMAGLFVSYWLNVPSGACIIFVSILIYGFVKTIKTLINQFK